MQKKYTIKIFFETKKTEPKKTVIQIIVTISLNTLDSFFEISLFLHFTGDNKTKIKLDTNSTGTTIIKL